jgi:signal transduction histidine kinase
VLGEIGDLLELLRTEDRDAEPLTPPPGLARLDELVEQFARSGLVVRLRVEGEPRRVTGATDVVAYRVIQEGLTNALKHGGDRRAHVLVEITEDQVAVVVTNPTGPPTPDAEGGGTAVGHGLVGLRERAASVRGFVETGLTAGGYRLAATLPLAKERP